MAVDVALLALGTYLGQKLFVSWSQTGALLGDANLLVATIVLATSVVLAGLMFGLYEPQTLWHRSRIAARSLLTITVAMLSACLVLHLLMYSTLSRRAAVAGVAFYLLTAPFLRLAVHGWVRCVKRGLLVIGRGPTTPAILRAVRRGAIPGYRLVGVVSTSAAESATDIPGVPEFIGLDEVHRVCNQQDVKEVIVAGGATDDGAAQAAAIACLQRGCRISDEISFFERIFGEVPAPHISPNWFLVADLTGHLEEHATVKRAVDLTIALLVLILTLPAWPWILLAVRLSSRGPILYSQTRIGQGGRPFTLYKFRTMLHNAEPNGSVWACPNDPRVTRIGRFLRRTRLDELPQLWNILRGEMSIVGPRPERPEFVAPLARLIPFYNERHLIKPGLTGWAQINFRYGASVDDSRRKLQLDLYYIKHMSLELDLVILLRTFGMILTGAC